jgi:hypothetical protein
MGEGSDRPLTVITGDRKTRERRAGRRRALDQHRGSVPGPIAARLRALQPSRYHCR